MLALVQTWRASGLSKKAFCARHHIKSGTFSYWVAKEKSLRDTPGFVRLDTSLPDTPYQITYPNGVKLQIPGTDLAMLSRLIHLF